MQRVGATYVGKKVYDYLMTSPEKPEGPDPEGQPVEAEAAPVADEVDGQLFHDDEGLPLGTARRVHGAAVYLVADGYVNPDRDLGAILADPETRLFWREDEGRITALFYVPDPNRIAERPRAMRADEV